MSACPCGRRHNVYADTIAVGRFSPAGLVGYYATRHADPRSLHPTREEAMRDVCPDWTPTLPTTTQGETR